MTRRAFLIGVIATILVLGASLTTARAHQLSDEQRAYAQLMVARQDCSRALAMAKVDGVSKAQLAPAAAAAQRLAGRRAPSPFPLFDSERVSFYNREAAHYVVLRTRIRAAEVDAARSAQADASRQITQLSKLLASARKIDVGIRSSVDALSTVSASVHSAVTPRQFQRVSSAARTAKEALARGVERQRAALRAVIARAGNTRLGVIALASSTAASTEPELALMALFTPRVTRYRQMLNYAVSDARNQSEIEQTAVRAMRVAALVDAVRTDYGRTVPQKFILVSTESQSASLYENGVVMYSTPVTTGGPELPTDHGVFHIYLKVSPFEFHSPWPPDSPYYYSPTPVNYWMPFYGGEGLHDASWRSNFGPGSNTAPTDLGGGHTILGTHGCVNLPAEAAALIWNWAPVGTAVVVT